jgi:hypothetical protein
MNYFAAGVHLPNTATSDRGNTATPPSSADVVEHCAFLEELIQALRIAQDTSRLALVPFLHHLPPPGLTVSHVVWNDYCDIRDALSSWRASGKSPRSWKTCRLDRYVDDAINESGRK